MTGAQSLDDRIFFAINDFAKSTPWLHTPMVAWAKYGIVAFALLMLYGLWSARHDHTTRLAAAIWVPIGMLVALGINQVVGALVGEGRPYDHLSNILVLADRTTDVSFPSDHSVMASSVAVGLWLLDRRLGLVAALLALVMGFARVYIAAHYPWDVLAGFALGTLVMLLGWRLARPLLEAAVNRFRTRGPLERWFAPAAVVR